MTRAARRRARRAGDPIVGAASSSGLRADRGRRGPHLARRGSTASVRRFEATAHRARSRAHHCASHHRSRADQAARAAPSSVARLAGAAGGQLEQPGGVVDGRQRAGDAARPQVGADPRPPTSWAPAGSWAPSRARVPVTRNGNRLAASATSWEASYPASVSATAAAWSPREHRALGQPPQRGREALQLAHLLAEPPRLAPARRPPARACPRPSARKPATCSAGDPGRDAALAVGERLLHRPVRVVPPAPGTTSTCARWLGHVVAVVPLLGARRRSRCPRRASARRGRTRRASTRRTRSSGSRAPPRPRGRAPGPGAIACSSSAPALVHPRRRTPGPSPGWPRCSAGSARPARRPPPAPARPPRWRRRGGRRPGRPRPSAAHRPAGRAAAPSPVARPVEVLERLRPAARSAPAAGLRAGAGPRPARGAARPRPPVVAASRRRRARLLVVLGRLARCGRWRRPRRRGAPAARRAGAGRRRGGSAPRGAAGRAPPGAPTAPGALGGGARRGRPRPRRAALPPRGGPTGRRRRRARGGAAPASATRACRTRRRASGASASMASRISACRKPNQPGDSSWTNCRSISSSRLRAPPPAGHARDRREQVEVEAAADTARRDRGVPGVGRQRREALPDRLGQRLRDVRRIGGQVALRGRVHQLLDVQRHAARPLRAPGRPGVGDADRPAAGRCTIRAVSAAVQPGQPDLLGHPLQQQPGRARTAPGTSSCELVGAQRPDDQQRQRGQPPGQVRDDLQAQLVAPVQVLQRQQRRARPSASEASRSTASRTSSRRRRWASPELGRPLGDLGQVGHQRRPALGDLGPRPSATSRGRGRAAGRPRARRPGGTPPRPQGEPRGVGQVLQRVQQPGLPDARPRRPAAAGGRCPAPPRSRDARRGRAGRPCRASPERSRAPLRPLLARPGVRLRRLVGHSTDDRSPRAPGG